MRQVSSICLLKEFKKISIFTLYLCNFGKRELAIWAVKIEEIGPRKQMALTYLFHASKQFLKRRGLRFLI